MLNVNPVRRIQFNYLLIPLLVSLMIAVSTDTSRAAEWLLEPEKSKLEFIVQIQNNTLHGVFEGFQAQIDIDPDDIPSGHIEISIDTGSIATGADQGNALAGSTDWLNIEAFPVARYQSTAMRSMGVNNYVATGLLTIKEARVPIDLHFNLTIEGRNAIATGSTTLNRSAFGIGNPYSDAEPIADVIAIKFTIHAREH